MRRLAIFAMLLALVASMAPVQYLVRCVLQEHEYGHACCVPANRAMRAECCSPVIAAASWNKAEPSSQERQCLAVRLPARRLHWKSPALKRDLIPG